MTCAVCRVPLTPRQGLCCSHRCDVERRRIEAAARRVACPVCGTVFLPASRGRQRPPQRLCSTACAQRASATTLTALLSLLDGNGWMTTSDLSIWLYGTVTRRSVQTVRWALKRLRQHGHSTESRMATWSRGREHAHRLVARAMQEAA